MPTLPPRFATVIVRFSALFRQRTWRHAEALLLGAILAPGVRTVASALRALGRADDPHFSNYHRVLSRAVWAPRHASRILLQLLVHAFVPTGPIVIGIDDTLERRHGARIAAKGIFHDPVRSTERRNVNAMGLRWLSAMLLAPVPWAERIWALPVLTALAPAPAYAAARGHRHKRLIVWARQLLRQLHRWLPGRPLVMVADGSFAALELLTALAPTMTCITRVRLDMALFAPVPKRRRRRPGRPRTTGRRLPTLAARATSRRTVWTELRVADWYGRGPRRLEVASGTAIWRGSDSPHYLLPIRWLLVRDPSGRGTVQALLSTDLTLTPAAILGYFVRRWQVEVTFEEARRHLGVETQRQWSDRAIARTTPVLLGLVSLVTLLAHELTHDGVLPTAQSAWYHKPLPTFSDAFAAVRLACWRQEYRRVAEKRRSPQNSSRAMIARLTNLLARAA